ncbi:Gfo/Idh/MocA family protein [Aquibacillus albus]|uniref:Dehydrogenase n=1 Tax=Aquibacillus albus TaxID=1168171 RepID=A0ABS2MWR1_9BACI|nr:Gfo/Idh/MocA family oxidoreductase [Aquibacillus albus]MBM7570336.1 putative dehydrogenase [Aquibacillus albus]
MVSFGIVGCGRVAEVHAAAISEEKDANLLALCDINDNRLEKMAKDYHVSDTYTSYQDMLNNPRIEVINICTPNGLHAEMAIQAMEKGKHVMIEKPLATTIEDANRIIETAKKFNVKATVVHQNRFNEAVQTTKAALNDGRFGKLCYGTASVRWNREQAYYDQDAWRGTKQMVDGVLMNQAIHTIDLFLWMMGPVKSVYGKTTTQLRDIEMEDVGTAIIEFESGTTGVLDGTGIIYPVDLGAGINLFGEKGTVSIGGSAVNQIKHWRFSRTFEKEEQEMLMTQKENPPSVYGDGHKTIIADFVQSIQQDLAPYVPLEAGLDAVKVILAIYESSKTGKTIYFNHNKAISLL